jgi:cyclic lactone autoinducer peptide
MKQLLAKLLNRKLTKSAEEQAGRRCFSTCYAPEIPKELQ